ncbi:MULTISPECIES: SUKH-4 family immunity protein [unclassified Streptomyces]|uniref:SUKH-4 family immunity protein n=1 Tax=unclassified Streptomyces TaxID=2593676 RepID=UPI0036EFFB7A
MVTFAQAQERAEEWINGDVASYQHREVRVREFELGFVVWAEDRAEGPRSDGGAQRLVIARDSGEATLWPPLPVGEVIRRYEEEYGVPDASPEPAPAPPARVDLNQTSFLLSPPEWLQEAADKLGIPDRREGAGAASGAGSGAGSGASSGAGAGASDGAGGRSVGAAAAAADAGVGSGGGVGEGASGSGSSVPGVPGASGHSGAHGVPAAPGVPRHSGVHAESSAPGVHAASAVPGVPSAPGGGTPWPAAAAADEPGSGPQDAVRPGVPSAATPWAGTDTNADAGDDRSVPLPATVFAPPLTDVDDAPPPAAPPEAKTALMSGGSQLPRTALAPAVDEPNSLPPTGPSQGSGAQGAGAPSGPPVTGSGAPQGATPPVAPSYGYPQGPGGPQGTPPPGAPPAYGFPQGPGTPPPGAPHAPGTPPAPSRPLPPNAGDIADAATSKAQAPPRGARGGGASAPPPPSAPGVPGARPGSTPPPSGPGAPGTPAGGYVPTQLVSQLGPDGPGGPAGPPAAPGVPSAPGAPAAPGAPQPPGGTPPPGGVHHAATMLAGPAVGGPGAPQPPGAPGVPGAPGAPKPPGAPGVPGAPGAQGQPAPPGAPGAPQPPGGTPPGGVHHAATMLAGPAVGGPGAPQPPGAPGVPGAPGASGVPGAPGVPNPPGGTPPGGVHHAATMLAGPPVGGPGAPPPPHAPGMPPGAPQPLPGQPMPGQQMPGQPLAPGQQPPAYGYPQAGQPTVGPGYQAVLRYRAQDGSEQQLIRRSAPGTPHPEWQMLHELRAMNVPPQQVLELHTELESCELPGAYCARMIRETWPQARITSIAPYGTDHASRQQGMHQLLAHQGELHQVADGPARPAPVRAPIPPVQPAPPIPPEAIGQELAAAFGPGVFRFDQTAVSRQGVPNIVAHTLVVAGLPVDMGPFFWAQAQPGRPVPTLAELAQERGVQPAPDAGSYLVMGSDFGKAICVQYGTANIVAVPVEAGPGGAPVPPQFVNTGLPEFARCLALLGRMWRLRFGLNQEQAGRWTVDFQAQLASLDPAALGSPESWWSVLLEQMWDGLL